MRFAADCQKYAKHCWNMTCWQVARSHDLDATIVAYCSRYSIRVVSSLSDLFPDFVYESGLIHAGRGLPMREFAEDRSVAVGGKRGVGVIVGFV